MFVVCLYGIVLSLHMLMCMCSRHKLLQAFARFAHVFGTYPWPRFLGGMLLHLNAGSPVRASTRLRVSFRTDVCSTVSCFSQPKFDVISLRPNMNRFMLACSCICPQLRADPFEWTLHYTHTINNFRFNLTQKIQLNMSKEVDLSFKTHYWVI
jgi:hypothetical protein